MAFKTAAGKRASSSSVLLTISYLNTWRLHNVQEQQQRMDYTPSVKLPSMNFSAVLEKPIGGPDYIRQCLARRRRRGVGCGQMTARQRRSQPDARAKVLLRCALHAWFPVHQALCDLGDLDYGLYDIRRLSLRVLEEIMRIIDLAYDRDMYFGRTPSLAERSCCQPVRSVP